MKWELAIVAATVLAVAAFSSRLTSTPVTPAMAFVAIGVLLGPLVIGEVTESPAGTDVRTLAEATLSVVLFADASRIKLRLLRHEYTVPLRLLAIGLPLTIVAGAVFAKALFGELSTAYSTISQVTCFRAGPSSTAPNTRNVTPPSRAPTSSLNRDASSDSREAIAPKIAPPTNAAMNPEPPSATAMPYASAAPATGIT